MAKGARFFSESEGSKHVSQSGLLAHRGSECFFPKGAFLTEREDEADTGKPILLGENGRLDYSLLSGLYHYPLDLYDGVVIPSQGVAVSFGITTIASATTDNDYIQIARIELSGTHKGGWIQLKGMAGAVNREGYPCYVNIMASTDVSGNAVAPTIYKQGDFPNYDVFVYLESDGGGSGIHYYKVYVKFTSAWQVFDAEVRARNVDATDCAITVWQTGNNEGESTPTGTLYQANAYYDDEFINLIDTPSSYSGQAGKFLKVDSTPDAVEFADIASSDLPAHASLHETGGGDAIDHGSIDGLGDDDHTQYHNDTRGDARYYQKASLYTDTEIDAALDMTNRVVKNTCLFRAYASAAQDNLTDNTWTTVVMIEDYDRGGDYAPSTFTAPVLGYYDLKAMVQVHDILDVISGDIEIRFLKNGTTQVSHYVLDTEFSTANRIVSLPLHDQLYLAANDTIVVQVKNNYGGSNLMDITTGTSKTYFTGRLVST